MLETNFTKEFLKVHKSIGIKDLYNKCFDFVIAKANQIEN